jgi:exosortase
MAKVEPSFAPPPSVTNRKPEIGNRKSAGWALLALPLAWLWFRLINNLGPEWATNPQYSYGLVVPLLVAGLLVRRWHAFPQNRKQKVENRNQFQLSLAREVAPITSQAEAREMASPISQAAFCFLAFLLAFLFLPTRLVEASTPEWRPLQWLLAIEVIGLTLYAVYLAGGKTWLRQAAFPVIFFLVAVPWPSPIEQPVIQGLSRLNASLVVNVLVIAGIPATQHGNVIEVSTGMVGINDACSGIRSFQSSLMISLFLGEFYRFTWRRRLLLLPIGFALALGFNLGRTSLLAWIAAQKGVAAIAEYHDEAGFTIMLACTGGLWGAAWLLSRQEAGAKRAKAESRKQRKENAGQDEAGEKQKSEIRSQKSDGCQKLEVSVGISKGNKLDTSPYIPLPDRGGEESGCKQSEVRSQESADGNANSKPSTQNAQPSTKTFARFSLALVLWLVFVEAGVGLWFHVREAKLKPGPAWTVDLPVANPTFKELPFSTQARELLRFDEGKYGQWQEPDGSVWQAFYLNWKPGRVAGYLAKRHTPEACLTASGLKMTAGPKLEMMNVRGVELPMRVYTFDSSGGPLQVFQCRWAAGETSSTTEDLTRFNLIRGIWNGRGNQGQKVLEIIITGYDDPELARQALVRQLDKLIKVAK